MSADTNAAIRQSVCPAHSSRPRCVVARPADHQRHHRLAALRPHGRRADSWVSSALFELAPVLLLTIAVRQRSPTAFPGGNIVAMCARSVAVAAPRSVSLTVSLMKAPGVDDLRAAVGDRDSARFSRRHPPRRSRRRSSPRAMFAQRQRLGFFGRADSRPSLSPAMAGGLHHRLDTGTAAWAYLTATAGQIIFIACFAGLPAIAPAGGGKRSAADLFAGFGFIRRTPVFLAAISLDMFAVLLGGATVLLPIFAKDILHVGPAGLGWLRAAPSAGSLMMALTLTRLKAVDAPRPDAARRGHGLRRFYHWVWPVAEFSAVARLPAADRHVRFRERGDPLDAGAERNARSSARPGQCDQLRLHRLLQRIPVRSKAAPPPLSSGRCCRWSAAESVQFLWYWRSPRCGRRWYGVGVKLQTLKPAEADPAPQADVRHAIQAAAENLDGLRRKRRLVMTTRSGPAGQPVIAHVAASGRR